MTAVRKIVAAMNTPISDRQTQQYGKAMHWGVGVAAGALYGLLRNRLLDVGIGSGLGYGLLFWLSMDEAMPLAFGLSAPPQEFPWQTHARGLAGHLVLGAALEAPFDLIAA